MNLADAVIVPLHQACVSIDDLGVHPAMNELALRLAQQSADRQSECMEQLMNNISEKLRTAIVASGKSYYALSKESGVDDVVISRFVSGERDLRLETAAKLAAVLGVTLVTLDELRQARGTKKPPAK